MNLNKHVLWVTRSAAFIALLIVTQALTASFGNQFITGSAVNLILIIATMTCGTWTGLAVAVISPFGAFLLGIGPAQLPIIPFQMAGNAAITLIWGYLGNLKLKNVYVSRLIAMIAGAVGKFLVLYFGVVKIAVPFLLNVPEERAAVISSLFSFPQLVTASIGGAIAVVILPVIMKAVKRV